MKRLLLNEWEVKSSIYPFAQISHVADLRVGILTIAEKWSLLAGISVERVNEDPETIELGENDHLIAANLLPGIPVLEAWQTNKLTDLMEYTADTRILQSPWHLFHWNDWAIRQDYYLLTRNRQSAPIPQGVTVTRPDQVFIEEGAKISPCFLNATDGPIYIGADAQILDGACIRGPFAVCSGGMVKMGAQVYGATTVGKYSVIGGEVKNSIIMDYSNKSHLGYLGDSVIGKWCNLGAGTSCSNLKNTGGPVRVWQESAGAFLTAGLKCGLLMGDYSRSAINTAFNTGTVVGICSHVFGSGLSPKHIPGFSWGMFGEERYELERAISDIEKWKKFKQSSITENEIKTLRKIFENSK